MRMGENVSSDNPLREYQGRGKARTPRKTVAAICLSPGFSSTEGKSWGVWSVRSAGPLQTALSGGIPAPHWELGLPAGWSWPSYRLQIKTAHRAALVGKAHHLTSAPPPACFLPSPSGYRILCPEAWAFGCHPRALCFGPYSATHAGPKQDIHLPVLEL